MHAAMIKARLVLAVSLCALALAFLVPVAANAQVTVKHIRVTITPATGSAGTTAVYCDTGTACPGGVQVWNLGTGVTLAGGQTLVLTQTGLLAGIGGNFDTSDRVRTTAPTIDDCTAAPHSCAVQIDLDTGSGLVTVYGPSNAGIALTNFNGDTGGNHIEYAPYGAALVTAPNYTLKTGYADTAHGCVGTCLPSPFADATVFKGAAVALDSPTCLGSCYDAGVILITGITVPQGCTFTQGYWKNHGLNSPGNQENEWPVNHLVLGTVNYTQLQLQSILDAPVKGNGLISLAHQLIAAKLNIANGANGSSIASTITAADALIGGKVVPPVGSGSLSTSSVAALVDALTAFNEGVTGPGHCGEDINID
jgi:hypothetical protein